MISLCVFHFLSKYLFRLLNFGTWIDRSLEGRVECGKTVLVLRIVVLHADRRRVKSVIVSFSSGAGFSYFSRFGTHVGANYGDSKKVRSPGNFKNGDSLELSFPVLLNVLLS